MDELDDIALHVAEYIEGRLYFVTLRTPVKPVSTSKFHFFTVDTELLYESFYSDFGPLNLAKLYWYCVKLNKKLKSFARAKQKIVHYTTPNPKKRVNAAFLIGAYSIIYLKKSAVEAYRQLVSSSSPLFISFRDASFGPCTYSLTLSDCLHAISKALENKFLDFENFDAAEYEHYEKVENGDLNWIVPNKFLAFCGPHSRNKNENGYPLHSPESYFSYFREHNVTTIIRLNKKVYDAHRFSNHGFDHKDLFFVDGSTPSDKIMEEFLEIAENAKGAIAVHCKAGLGRTGTLIACYIMKHHHFTAAEAIAWIRICRPGSIIGNQQHWLEEKQGYLCYQGNIFRAEKASNCRNNNYTPSRIQTRSSKNAKKNDETVSQILTRVDQIHLDDKPPYIEGNTRSRREKALQNGAVNSNNDNNNNNATNESDITQGDKLNRIKAMRRQPRSHTTGGLVMDHLKTHPRSSSQPFKPLTLSTASYHSNYVSPLKPLRTSGASHSSSTEANSSSLMKSQTKRNTANHSPAKRRTWRHVVSSPENSGSHRRFGLGPTPEWDLNTFISSNTGHFSSASQASAFSSVATNSNHLPISAPPLLPTSCARVPVTHNEDVRHSSAPHLTSPKRHLKDDSSR